MSVNEWIESRVEGGHGTPFGQLLDVAYATEYGADTTDQSALNLLYLLGFQPENPPALSIFGESACCPAAHAADPWTLTSSPPCTTRIPALADPSPPLEFLLQ